MKIFLTGASGFIGKKFALLAIKSGNYIFAPIRKKYRKKFKHKNIEWLNGEFDQNWNNELSKSDVLVHIAADGVNKNFSKIIGEKNSFITKFLIPLLKSSNLLGITPEPYRKGTFSKSM